MNILGVTFTEALSFEPHITRICCKARQSMYALRILVAHGLKGLQLYDVVRATTVARLLYAAPAWWGFAGQQDRCRLQSVISKLIRLRYLPEDYPKFERLCLEADIRLFSAVLMNQGHVLHSLLKSPNNIPCDLDRTTIVYLLQIIYSERRLLLECCTPVSYTHLTLPTSDLV